jgi:hypothetical protein
MGYQYRSGNWQNEDNNSVHDVRALRYLLAINSTNNSSSVGINNRNIVRGSRTTTVQSIHEKPILKFRIPIVKSNPILKKSPPCPMKTTGVFFS